MTKGRSPNYPQLTLAEAITRTQSLYQAIHTYPSPKAVIAENLGYGGLNGKSLTVIGTLRRYGLLEPAGAGHLAISGGAVTILELPSGDADRAKALEEAAFQPSLFADLQQDFGDKLPNDVTLRHHLIKKGFLPKAADEAIRIYRANLELVRGEGSAYNERSMSPSASKIDLGARTFNASPLSSASASPSPAPPGSEPGTKLRFKISRESEALVSFTGMVTQEAIEKLIQYLQLAKEEYVSPWKPGTLVRVISETQHKAQIGQVIRPSSRYRDMVGLVQSYWIRFSDDDQPYEYDDNDLLLES